MDNYPTLYTERLVLNQLVIGDIPEIVIYANNINVTSQTKSFPFPFLKKDAENIVKKASEGAKTRDKFVFAIRKKQEGYFIGSIGLHIDVVHLRAEIGYWLAEPFWNNGYTTEAVKAILAYGFESLHLNKIIAMFIETNKASGKVMIKNGMIKEAELKEHDFKDGKFVSLIQYRLLKSEYESLKKRVMNTNVILENERVKLSPLTLANFQELILIGAQEKLVQFSPSAIATPETLKTYVETALKQKENGTSIPFIIFDKKTKEFAGCTRFMHINLKNKVLHIGATWIGKQYQGTELNQQMKHLMLNYAFDQMGFEKVEFRIDERNVTSRKAVEKLGGVLEGILRKDTYMLNGFKRNTCCYGILKDEWQAKAY